MNNRIAWRRAGIVLLTCMSAVGAPAQTFTTLASFNGTNGANPEVMSLVQGLDGNLYGTAGAGGAGFGTVFMVTPGGILTAVHSFDGTDGSIQNPRHDARRRPAESRPVHCYAVISAGEARPRQTPLRRSSALLHLSKWRRDILQTKQVLPIVALLSHAALCAQTIVTIDVPGADGTTASAINDAGVTAGSYGDSNFASHGFLRDLTGAIATFDVPGAGTADAEGTFASSINGGGVITGWYTDTNIQTHGFLRDGNGAMTTFDAPHDARGTFATCINAAGVIAGYVTFETNISRAFVRTAGGTIFRFDPPGALESKALAIDAAGDITGWFSDRNLAVHGFVRAADGTIATFDAPGATAGTYSTAINAAGVIAGYAPTTTSRPTPGCAAPTAASPRSRPRAQAPEEALTARIPPASTRAATLRDGT